MTMIDSAPAKDIYGHLKTRPNDQDDVILKNQDNDTSYIHKICKHKSHIHRTCQTQGNWRHYPSPPPRLKNKLPTKYIIKGMASIPKSKSIVHSQFERNQVVYSSKMISRPVRSSVIICSLGRSHLNLRECARTVHLHLRFAIVTADYKCYYG